jgi:DNA primase catalytic core
MQITKQEIDTVKRSHNLIEVIESYGVKLRKKGTNFVGLCPFHKEKTPSFTINPKTNLYHCFGCNAGGDVIGFVCKKEGIGFREAVQKLSGNGHKVIYEVPKQPPPSPVPSINRARLLNRVVSFYHKTFCEDQRAVEYLKARGITDNAIFADFKIGFSNGTLLNTIPEDGDVRDALKEIGILNSKGHEMFYGCVIFPMLDENKDCVGLYGRRLVLSESEGTQNINSPNHLYLSGPRKGVFNYQAAKRSKSIILTESIIDALTLFNAGFKDVIPCYGVNGLIEDHLTLFARCQTKEVYLCFDRDDAGNQGTERIAGQLRDKGIDSYIVNLPSPASQEKVDINSFFLSTADAPLIFEKLLREANSRVSIRSDRLVKQETRHYEKTDTGFVVQYGERRYEVRGITREGVKLKVTIKAIKQPSEVKGQRFHLDTVDLNSNRSRLFFAKACAVLFSEKEDLVTEDLLKLIDLCESWKPEQKEKDLGPRMTKTEEEKALEFLKSPDLFSRILEDFEVLGVTGEESNKLMGYLSAISRKLDEPLSIMIQSRSAAGKSTLQDAILSFIPPEDFVKYTRLTGQALFYKEENSLIHKLLAIEEEHGAREASYSIRNIQSSKHLSIAATGKDPITGKLKTEEYRVKGPVSLLMTTTEVAFDEETSNRFITLTIDESREMTERILKRQREEQSLEGLLRKAQAERIRVKHHNAQRLLRPLQVINPYYRYLTFSSESLRARREHKKYLGLIIVIAYLHQYQREIKAIDNNGSFIQLIEVALEDIERANHLAHEILGRSLDELSPPSRSLLMIIHEMVLVRCKELGIEPKDYRFTRRDIREWSKWSDPQIKRHIRQLEELEYLYSVSGKKGKEYVYELLYSGGGERGRAFFMGLVDVSELRRRLNLDGKKTHLDA